MPKNVSIIINNEKTQHKRINNTSLPLAKYGWKELLIFSFLAALPLAMSIKYFHYIAPAFMFGLFFVVYFFRDSRRVMPEGADKPVSPADGTVVEIEDTFENNYLKDNEESFAIAQ